MEIKYTKINKIYEVNNDMAHNYYYVYYGKIINDEKTRCRKFKFVLWFDIFDLQEFYEKDTITKEEIKEYADQLCCDCVENYVKDYNDTDGLKQFYNWCNSTIENYNRILN